MIWFIGVLFVLAAALLGLNTLYPGALGADDARMSLAYGVALLILLASGISITNRTQLKQAVKAAISWAAIFLALVTLYSYQDGFRMLGSQMLAALDPARPRASNVQGTVEIQSGLGGHFYVNAKVDGRRVRFLVDTGASRVVLAPRDARRLGFHERDLAFGTPVSTANGVTLHAPVRLKSVTIGDIEIRGVDAFVAREGLGESLLGMNVLRRLSSYEFTRRTLILKE